MGELFTLLAEFVGVLIEFGFSPKKRAARAAAKKQFAPRKRILQDSSARHSEKKRFR